MQKKWLFIGIIIFVLFIVTSWFAWQLHRFEDRVLIKQQDVYYDLKPGTSLTQVAKDFKKMHLIKHPYWFVLFTQLEGKSGQLQAGEYLFPQGATSGKVLDMLVKGLVIKRSLTIVEGWNITQTMQAVNSNPYLKHTLNNIPQDGLLVALGYKSSSAEGMLYPDTYLFVRGTDDKVVLRKAYLRMQNILNKEWQNRADNLPYKTPYQALIAASLIEKETAIESEKPLVAGVIALRLEKNMPLQIDPTVIYGMGINYEGNISRKDLQTDTPYNTYTRRGLPPTPIAMPSESSIHAALHPNIEEGYLYFVATGDGSHRFSKTLKQQDKAVKAYLKQLKQTEKAEDKKESKNGKSQ